jgi:hypothetical protein
VTRVIGTLLFLFVAMLLLSVLLGGDKIHWIAAERDIERAEPADSIEIDDLREMGQLDGYSRTISDRDRITKALSAVKNAPGKWKQGSFREPDGYLFMVFQKKEKDPPGDSPLMILRLGHGFLVHGNNGRWEYKFIGSELESMLLALGPRLSPIVPAQGKVAHSLFDNSTSGGHRMP